MSSTSSSLDESLSQLKVGHMAEVSDTEAWDSMAAMAAIDDNDPDEVSLTRDDLLPKG